MRRQAANRRDIFKDADFSALGQAILAEAKRINHQRHIDGELDPDWQQCLQQAQRTVMEKFLDEQRAKQKGGHANGTAK